MTDAKGRPRELDLGDGTRRAVAPGTVGWCMKPTEYEQHLGYEINGEEITDYTGENALFACTAATGRRTAVPPQVPAFLGPRSGDLVVWSDTSAVLAAPVAG